MPKKRKVKSKSPLANPVITKITSLQKEVDHIEEKMTVDKNLKDIKREINKIQQEIRTLPPEKNKKYGLPASLWIQNSMWEIRLVDGLRHNSKAVNGLCCFADKVISLDIKNKSISQTFLHEVIHALDRSLGVEEPNKAFDEYKTRVLASCWDSIFFQLLKSMKGGESNVQKEKNKETS